MSRLLPLGINFVVRQSIVSHLEDFGSDFCITLLTFFFIYSNFSLRMNICHPFGVRSLDYSLT